MWVTLLVLSVLVVLVSVLVDWRQRGWWVSQEVHKGREGPSVRLETTGSQNPQQDWNVDQSAALLALLKDTKSSCDLPIVVANESSESLALINRLVRNQLPFIYRGFAHNWPAIQSWKKAQLLNDYGNRTIREDSASSIVHNSGGVSQGQTLRDYIKGLAQVDEHNRNDHFVFDTNVLESIPELRKDVLHPPFLSHWDNAQNEEAKRMWHMLSVGPSMSGLPMHTHGETWIALVAGAKHWFLYPPGYDVDDRLANECHALCTVTRWMRDIYPQLIGLPDLFSISNASESRSQSHNGEGLSNAEKIHALEEISRLPEGSARIRYRPMECVQQAGDLVYLPDAWLHLTFNIGETIGYGGQSALVAQKRYDLANGILSKRSDNFVALKDRALATAHLLNDHKSEVQIFAPYFDRNSRTLVLPSRDAVTALVSLTQHPLVLVECTSGQAGADSRSSQYSAAEVMALLSQLSRHTYLSRLDLALLVDDKQHPLSSPQTTVQGALQQINTCEISVRLLQSPIAQAEDSSRPIVDYAQHYSNTFQEISYECFLEEKGVASVRDIAECVQSNLRRLAERFGIDEESLAGESGASSRWTRSAYRSVQRDLSSALELRPWNLGGWRLLAEMHGEMRNLSAMSAAIDKADALYSSIVARESSIVSPLQTAAIYHQLASSYLSANVASPALLLLEKALAIQPRYAPALVDRVVAAGMTGNRTLAAQRLLDLKRAYPAHASIPQLMKYLRHLHSAKK